MDEKGKKFPKAGPVAAVVVLMFELVVFFYILTPVQYYFGMWGLAITELALVVISLVAAWVVDLNLKEMLPFKRIKINQFFGTIVMWIGSLLLVVLANLIFFYYRPEGLKVNGELNSFISTWAVIPALIVVSVMPAICEEMLHRGFIQRCLMKKINSKMLISIIMGIFFGLFHMDFYRFIGTAILGGVLSYILVTTDNFFYNMLFHFTNNLFAQLMSILAGSMMDTMDTADTLTSEELPLAIAGYLIIGCVTPLLLLGGSLLLKGIRRIKEEGTMKLIISIVAAVVIAMAMFAAGCVMMVSLYMAK